MAREQFSTGAIILGDNCLGAIFLGDDRPRTNATILYKAIIKLSNSFHVNNGRAKNLINHQKESTISSAFREYRFYVNIGRDVLGCDRCFT